MRPGGRAAGAVALALVLPAGALAFSGGATGFSGKTAASCNDCHQGATAPMTVTLTQVGGAGPLRPGEPSRFTLDVVTAASLKQIGWDIATSDGTLAAGSADSRESNGELTQSAPLVSNTASVPFSLTPSATGTITLFATALAGDGSGTVSGDKAGTVALALSVVEPTDLLGADLLGIDFATPPDLAEAVDSGTAAPPDMARRPRTDEPRWACDCQLGAPRRGPTAGVVGILGALLVLARRLRRA